MRGMLRSGLMAGSAACVIAGALAAMPAAALAREADAAKASDDASTVGEVVVTARRREEKLGDVPISATVIDAQVLGQRGTAQTGDQLLAGVPGVRFFNTSSPNNSEISVRASGTSRSSNTDPSVGLYRNDMFIAGGFLGGRGYTSMDLFDIGQVQVLRGPQGALYGRDAVGGAIIISSAKPTPRDEGYADARYGFTNKQFQAQVVENHPFNEVISTRLGLNYYQQSGGFNYLSNFHDYADQTNGVGLRGQIGFSPGGGFTANLLVEGQVLETPGLYQSYTIPAGTTGFPHGYTQNPRSVPWNTPSVGRQNQQTVILEANWDLGWANVSSNTGYRNRHSRLSYDTDFVDAATLAALKAGGDATNVTDSNTAQALDDTTRLFHQDIHVAGAKIHGITWLVGAEYLRQQTNFQAITTRTPTVANPSAGNRAPSVLIYNSAAVYGSLTYDVTQQLSVTGELRYTADDEKFTANRFDVTTGAQSGGSRYIIDARQKPDNTSWDFNVGYKLPGRWLVYGKVGTAYRAGGFNQDRGDPRGTPVIPISYGPETTISYELGAKGRVGSHIYMTAAAYREITDDFILQQSNNCLITNPVCPAAASSFQTNAGTAHIWGVEAEVNVRVTVLDGRLVGSVSGSRQGGKLVSGPFSGANIPQTPDSILGADLDYRHAALGGSTVFGHVNFAGQWGGVQEITHTPALADFQTWNVRLGVDFGHAQFSAFANNAFDEEHVIYATATAKRYSQPRVIGVELRYGW